MGKKNKKYSHLQEFERMNSLLQLLSERLNGIEKLLSGYADTNSADSAGKEEMIVIPEEKPEKCGTVISTEEKIIASSFSQEKNTIPIVTRVRDFLLSRYEFRCNRLTGQTEYRNLENDTFHPVDKRARNTFYFEVQASGIFCYESQLQCFLNSFLIEEYHPFTDYLENLPAWDGTDRIHALSRRVSSDSLWHIVFRRWMLGMTAQWLGKNPKYAHSLAPLLVSREQGLHKSTFCKMLLPPELGRYYTDNFSLTNLPQAERKLTEYGLISLDEFDRHSSRNQADLKNLMQTTTLHLRQSYQSHTATLPRIASFIGTSNCRELLTDKTGSRRFYCVEVTRPIDTDTPLDYAQLYAQLKYLVGVAGEPYWPTTTEKAAIEAHNLTFYKTSVEENLFHEVFREAERGTAGSLLLSAEEIFRRLRHHNPPAMRGRKAGAFGKLLIDMGISRIRLNTGNRYCVIPFTEPTTTAEEEKSATKEAVIPGKERK